MNMKNMLLCAVFCASVSGVQARTLGEKLDNFLDDANHAAKYLVIRARLFTGNIPPVTRENIEKYPEYKEAYITYAVRNPTKIPALAWAKLIEKYPDDMKSVASYIVNQTVDDAKEKADRAKKKFEDFINK